MIIIQTDVRVLILTYDELNHFSKTRNIEPENITISSFYGDFRKDFDSAAIVIYEHKDKKQYILKNRYL